MLSQQEIVTVVGTTAFMLMPLGALITYYGDKLHFKGMPPEEARQLKEYMACLGPAIPPTPLTAIGGLLMVVGFVGTLMSIRPLLGLPD